VIWTHTVELDPEIVMIRGLVEAYVAVCPFSHTPLSRSLSFISGCPSATLRPKLTVLVIGYQCVHCACRIPASGVQVCRPSECGAVEAE